MTNIHSSQIDSYLETLYIALLLKEKQQYLKTN